MKSSCKPGYTPPRTLFPRLLSPAITPLRQERIQVSDPAVREGKGMKFGVCLPNNWGVEDVQAIFLLAVRAEELGFDSVWVSEHIFNVSYVYDRIGGKPYYEPLTILGYVAAMTKRVALGTSVLVLPYHNPIRLAKVAATLDVMSAGRLILGVGVGVIPQELQAMGSPFADRGAI